MTYKPNYELMWKNWRNVTYPFSRFPFWNLIFPIWKSLFCKAGFHLFDEVGSSEGHFLYCDACDLDIRIDDTEYKE